MAGERYVVLGLGTARATWFVDVARWSTVGSIPVEFVKCISAEEVRARIESGRPFSAAIVDADTGALDRDTFDLASRHGVAVIVVDGGSNSKDWSAIGADAVLSPSFDRTMLVDALGRCGPMIEGAHALPTDAPSSTQRTMAGPLFAVTGSPGAGASSVAIALAQGLTAASDQSVVLADLCLHADQAMLHDARDIIPGIQELTEAHRTRHLSSAEVRALTFKVEARGYHLMLGLRRHHDWSVLRARAFEAAMDGLQGAFSAVVADVDADVEGARLTGSVEVEERNVMARTALTRADVVLVVGRPGIKGAHALVRLANTLREFGVNPARVVAAVIWPGRTQQGRADFVRAFADLTGATAGLPPMVGPVFVSERRSLDELHRDSARLPTALTEQVTRAAQAVLDRQSSAPRDDATDHVPIVRGSLGRWADQEAATT